MKKALRVLPYAAAVTLLAAFSLPAAAQSAGSTVLNVGWFHIQPNDSSETLLRTNGPRKGPQTGTAASVGNSDTLGIGLTYFVTDNFAMSLDAGIPPTFKLRGEGTLTSYGELGQAKQWSPAVVAKWYFGDANSKFRPYVGAGVTYVWYSDVELTPTFQKVASLGGQSATAKLSSSWAPVASMGATYNIDKNWSLGLSVSYVPIKTKAEITGQNAQFGPQTATTSLTLNPLVTFLSVGYRF